MSRTCVLCDDCLKIAFLMQNSSWTEHKSCGTSSLLSMTPTKPQQWLQVVGHAGLWCFLLKKNVGTTNLIWLFNSFLFSGREFSHWELWHAAEEVLRGGTTVLPEADEGRFEAFCSSLPRCGAAGRAGLQHDG